MGVLRVRDGGAWVDLDVGTGSWVPIGVILMYAGATPPGGFMLCNGNQVSRITYPALFTAIGTAWGVGDGTTTFNLPDLMGRVAAGAGAGAGLTNRVLGTKFGAETHTLLAAESGMPAHTPTAFSGTVSVDHSHGFSASTGYQSSDHGHYTAQGDVIRNVGGGFFVPNAAGGYNYTPAQLSTGGVTANHYHDVSGSTGGISANHTHGITVNQVAAANAAASHNNVQPTAVVNHIIRVS